MKLVRDFDLLHNLLSRI